MQHEQSATGKDYYIKKWNKEMVQSEKSATRKECNTKKYKLPHLNTEKVHKNSVSPGCTSGNCAT